MAYGSISVDLPKILEPLKLESPEIHSSNELIPKSDSIQECLLCDKQDFENQDLFLKHLFEIHRLVIADVSLIADFKSYIKYWKHRFLNNKIEEFCTTMLLDKKPDGSPSKDEKYYLLSDIITEDKTLRYELQQNRLEHVLEQHRKERTDRDFSRECWFCHLQYNGLRSGFFTHLSEAHNFQLGTPDKLVFTTELLDILESKLNNLQCIYCEKIFKDRLVLKEHMRKKMHKKINPDDTNFDKYYLINYLEIGKTWQSLQKEKLSKTVQKRYINRRQTNSDNDDSEDSDWSEWDEKFTTNIYCLFCTQGVETDFEKLLDHMKEKHNFDFIQVTENLTFYDKIRLVNYIRRQIYLHNCIFCEINIDTAENLHKHMTASRHYRIPERNVWNRAEYFFPTYEDDSFLCYLDDVRNENLEPEEAVVVVDNDF